MARFANMPSRTKIRLIHLNQSNPLLRDAAGLPVARQGQREPL
jgi:hypothetical protein